MLKLKRRILMVQAAFFAGFLLGPGQALASNIIVGGGGRGNNNFSDISQNVVDSIAKLPGLLSGIAYMFGILLGVLGVLKVKDHVENPSNTPLKDGAIRMASGGALFALPIVYEAMRNTIGLSSGVSAAALSPVIFHVR
jgi:hypothetical protein